MEWKTVPPPEKLHKHPPCGGYVRCVLKIRKSTYATILFLSEGITLATFDLARTFYRVELDSEM